MFCGDFRQLAPIVEGSRNASDVINASLSSSPLWGFIKKMNLSVGQRCTDPEYSKFLLQVGNGTAPEVTFQLSEAEDDDRTEQLIAIDKRVRHVTQVEALIEEVFPDEVIENPDQCADRAILSTHNINVKAINTQIMNRLEGEEMELLSADSVAFEHNDHVNLYDIDILHQAEAKGVPSHVLRLKVGALCMVMRTSTPTTAW